MRNLFLKGRLKNTQ